MLDEGDMRTPRMNDGMCIQLEGYPKNKNMGRDGEEDDGD